MTVNVKALRELIAKATKTPWTRLPGSALVKGDTFYNSGLVAECEDNVDLPYDRMSDADMMKNIAKPNADLIVAMRIVALVRDLAELEWEDVDDEWTQEIKAAHPTRNNSHEAYATAMKMVGHRHSKAQLVNLASWLLQLAERSESELERLRPFEGRELRTKEVMRSCGFDLDTMRAVKPTVLPIEDRWAEERSELRDIWHNAMALTTSDEDKNNG